MNDSSNVHALLPSLHDAVLLSVEVQWGEGKTIVALRSSAGALRLVVTGTRQVQVARAFPWGPSECINSVTLEQIRGDCVLLTIEMQSGDMLSVSGSSVAADAPIG
jgi:hypothetical protein